MASELTLNLLQGSGSDEANACEKIFTDDEALYC